MYWNYDEDLHLNNGSAGYVSGDKSFDRSPIQFPGVGKKALPPEAQYKGKAH